MEPTRKCPHCGRTRTLSNFPLNKSRPTGHTEFCRDCHNESARKSRAAKQARVDEAVSLLSPADRQRLGFA